MVAQYLTTMIGKLRKDFMPETISPGSIDVIQGIKKSQDPEIFLVLVIIL